MKYFQTLLLLFALRVGMFTLLAQTPNELVQEGQIFLNNGQYTEAIRCFNTAAQADDAAAFYYLGIIAANGYGVIPNDERAMQFFNMAVDRGYTLAYNGLGVLAAKRENYGEALKYYTMAAEKGHAIAQKNLGIMYQFGSGVAENHTEAAKWYKLAAEKGNAMAQASLAKMYLEGDGISQDYEKAFHFYKLSAEQQYWLGEYGLAAMYENGYGVPKNRAEAVKWYEAAAAQGHEGAKEALERIREEEQAKGRL